MREIVEKSELSKGAVYHYFESKEQLFTEIVEQFIFTLHYETFHDLPSTTLKEFYQTFLQRIVKNVSNLRKLPIIPPDQEDSKLGFNYYTIVTDAFKMIPKIREKFIAMEAAERASWENAVSGAIESGEIRTAMRADQIASIYMFTNDGIGMRVLTGGNVRELGPQLSQLWDSFYADLSR